MLPNSTYNRHNPVSLVIFSQLICLPICTCDALQNRDSPQWCNYAVYTLVYAILTLDKRPLAPQGKAHVQVAILGVWASDVSQVPANSVGRKLEHQLAFRSTAEAVDKAKLTTRWLLGERGRGLGERDDHWSRDVHGRGFRREFICGEWDGIRVIFTGNSQLYENEWVSLSIFGLGLAIIA